MSDEEALIRVIFENQEEDTPRLALADCLEENGYPDRAEWIRLRVEHKRLPKPGEGETIAVMLRRADIEKRLGELCGNTDVQSWRDWIEWLHDQGARKVVIET
jgi:uncharacterized protein (TIGR02996 family)